MGRISRARTQSDSHLSFRGELLTLAHCTGLLQLGVLVSAASDRTITLPTFLLFFVLVSRCFQQSLPRSLSNCIVAFLRKNSCDLDGWDFAGSAEIGQ